MRKALRTRSRVFTPLVWLVFTSVPAIATANPVTLGSRPIDAGIGFLSMPVDRGTLTVYSGGYELFETTLISAADIGRTIVQDASTDPDFSGFVTRLTNGRANSIGYLFGVPGFAGGKHAPSETVFFNLPAPKIDFAGSTITAVMFTVRELSLAPWMGHPGFTLLHLNGDLAVQGVPGPTPTPEPSTVLLLGAGLAGVIRSRRRRASSHDPGR